MEVEDEELFTKTCYKCEQSVLDAMSIVYNSPNSKTFLWNKYQIFVYEDMDFKSPVKTFMPQFQVHLVIASNIFIVCLDCNGNIHTASLKFKNSSENLLSIPSRSRDQGIKTCIRYKENHILSLKYEADTYFLSLHGINASFELEKKMILLCNSEHWPLEQNSKEKHLLTCYTINEDIEHFKKIFNIEQKVNGMNLVVLSLDNLAVYGGIFSPTMIEDDMTLVKLYQCPAEICYMEVIESGDLCLLIGLTMGTIIRLSFNDLSKAPNIVHLNTALYKMIVLKDSVLYTDGVTMWKAEKMFTKEINLTQLFVRNTNDFTKCGEQIVCTTFSKLIYKFSVEDKTAYLFRKDIDEYCSAEKLMNNSEYFNKLFQEIDSNNELVKKLVREQDYITVLSLSNRQDIVKKAIESNVIVFERYDEVNNTDFTLTEEIYEYFQADIWLFLVKVVNINIYDTLNSILSHLLDNIHFYITLSTPQQVLKTTCIKMDEPLKAACFLIPLNMNGAVEINVNIKIVVNIPGALHNKQQLSVLYRKDIVLSSEHFIKTSNKTAIKSLKTASKSSTENLILKNALSEHGLKYNFTDASLSNESKKEWSFYVNLPDDYEQIFKTGKYCKKFFSHSKTKCLVELWSAEEFLKSKSLIVLSIGDEKLKIKIENDGFSNPQLKVTSDNTKTAFNIRIFFSKIFYNEYENKEPGKEFIGYSFYATTENLQKAVKKSIKSSATLEEFLPIIDQFEKNVIGALPL